MNYEPLAVRPAVTSCGGPGEPRGVGRIDDATEAAGAAAQFCLAKTEVGLSTNKMIYWVAACVPQGEAH